MLTIASIAQIQKPILGVIRPCRANHSIGRVQYALEYAPEVIRSFRTSLLDSIVFILRFRPIAP